MITDISLIDDTTVVVTFSSGKSKSFDLPITPSPEWEWDADQNLQLTLKGTKYYDSPLSTLTINSVHPASVSAANVALRALFPDPDTSTGETGNFELNYNSYTGILSQQDNDAPDVIILENNIGNIIWTVDAATGVCTATLADAFPANKTILFLGSSGFNNASSSTTLLNSNWIDENTIKIIPNVQNGITGLPFEIRVYK